MKTLTDESFKPEQPSTVPSGLALVHDDAVAPLADRMNGDQDDE